MLLQLRGDPVQQFQLGLIYQIGKDGIRNVGKAEYWYEKAALRGHVEAQVLLAALFAMKEYGNVDVAKAFLWASTAAKNGHELGKKIKEDLERFITPSERSEARRLASSKGLPLSF